MNDPENTNDLTDESLNLQKIGLEQNVDIKVDGEGTEGAMISITFNDAVEAKQRFIDQENSNQNFVVHNPTQHFNGQNAPKIDTSKDPSLMSFTTEAPSDNGPPISFRGDGPPIPFRDKSQKKDALLVCLTRKKILGSM